MAKPLLDDGLWALVEPLLPPPKKRHFLHPGRKPLEDRKVLTGIIFILTTGIPFEYLPKEMGCGCGMTCWNRLREWQKAGVWEKIHRVLLEHLQGADKIDWSRAVVDSSSVRADGAGEKKPAPIPQIAPARAANTTSSPTPMAFRWPLRLPRPMKTTSGSCCRSSRPCPPVRGKPGRPRQRPDEVLGDRAYDSEPHRRAVRTLRIEPYLAKRGTEHGSGLGVYRWVVERTLAWLHKFRRLRVRYERRADIHEAFLSLGCILICWHYLSG